MRRGKSEMASSDNRWQPRSDGRDEVVCLQERERENEEEVHRQSCLLMELAAGQTLYEGV